MSRNPFRTVVNRIGLQAVIVGLVSLGIATAMKGLMLFLAQPAASPQKK